MFAALSSRNYRLYFAGGVLSNTGTWFQRVGQDWLVLQLSDNSGTALGITAGLQFLPMLLLTPYAGLVADRLPKRRVLLSSQAVMAVASLTLGLLSVTGEVRTEHVYVLALVFGVGSAFDAPARHAFVSEMVEPEFLTNAVGLNAASFNFARVLGPALAGLLIGALGADAHATGYAILVNSVSYGAVFAALLRMRLEDLRPTVPAERRQRGMIREAVRYSWCHPEIRLVMTVILFTGAFGLNFQLTTALMATEVYDMGATSFGLLTSAIALGSFSAAVLASRRERPTLRLLLIAAVGFAVVQCLASTMPSYWAFAACMPALGLTWMSVAVTANASIQVRADPILRGRTMALYMTILQGSTPIGAPVLGWVGEVAGPRWMLVCAGSVSLCGTLAAILIYRRSLNSQPAPSPEGDEVARARAPSGSAHP